MTQLLILREAEAELREAVAFYEERSRGLGTDFLSEIESGLEGVRRMPQLWPVRKDGTRRFLTRRFPYMIVYMLYGGRIWVLAIAHCRRKSGYWRERIQLPASLSGGEAQ